MHTASALTWMQLIGLGALMGAIGQGIRAIVGLKKVHDAATTANVATTQLIDSGRLLTSIVIGAIAGVLASVNLVPDVDQIGSAQLVALLGAGYAGADFIEGFMNRARPGGGEPPAPLVSSDDDAVG